MNQPPTMQQPQAPDPQLAGRVPLRFGGQTIPVDHPLYDVIKRIILERYAPQFSVPGSQG